MQVINLIKENVMKQLNVAQANLVSGGDYDLNMVMHVPSAVAAQMSGLITAIVTGQITDTASFANMLTSVGPTLNEVRVDTISFSNFN
jgi:hypothetical protein